MKTSSNLRREVESSIIQPVSENFATGLFDANPGLSLFDSSLPALIDAEKKPLKSRKEEPVPAFKFLFRAKYQSPCRRLFRRSVRSPIECILVMLRYIGLIEIFSDQVFIFYGCSIWSADICSRRFSNSAASCFHLTSELNTASW